MLRGVYHTIRPTTTTNYPNGPAIDHNGNVYIADTYNHRIQVFMSDGTYLRSWGSQGHGLGQSGGLSSIATAHNGNVYIADTYNHRIQVFASDGSYLRGWGSEGNGQGQFS